MGKFILGILAIILLQVIFFGYTSRYWSIPKEPGMVKSRPNLPTVRRPTELAQAEPPAASVAEVPSPARETQNRPDERRVSTSAIARPKTGSNVAMRKRVMANRVPSRTYTVKAESRPYDNRLGTVIPRGHTMVLVDKFPPARNTSGTSASVHVVKPRNRSFLAKSFSVVVKKPWGWMKSLASKLD